MKAFAIAAVFVLTVSCSRAAADDDRSFVSFEPSPSQTSAAQRTQWEKLSPEIRKDIEHFLLLRMGLSSTGTIQLIGVYGAEIGQPSDKPPAMYHFRQLDLLGSRLFWSVLVDPAKKQAHVLFHVNERYLTDKPVPFDEVGKKQAR